MEKYRVGVHIPELQTADAGRSVFDKGDRFLPVEITRPLVDRLRADPDIELIEDLNYKRAIVEGNRVWVNDVCLNELDLYVWYTVQDPVTPCFGLDVLEVLSAETKVMPHPVNFANGLDKFRSHSMLKRTGAMVADFALFDHRNLTRAQKLIDQWGAALLKPRRGNFGMGVTLIDNPTQLRDIVDYVYELAGGRSPDAGFLLERFYPNDVARWTSVVVVDGEVAYGYRKKPSKFVDMGNGAGKVYDTGKVGGQVDICEVNDMQRRQAKIAAGALRLPLVSFDMIDYQGSPVIVDENTYPGLYTQLLPDRGVSIAHGLFSHIMRALTTEHDYRGQLGTSDIPSHHLHSHVVNSKRALAEPLSLSHFSRGALPS